MTNPELYLPETSAVVTVCWRRGDGFFAETRRPGAPLEDLPEDMRAEILAHWTPARVAQWEAAEVAAVEPVTVDYSGAIQSHLDATARQREYDGILSAISYRDDPNPVFAAEAAALFAWRSAVWTAASAMLDGLGGGEPPAVADVIAALPEFAWPQ